LLGNEVIVLLQQDLTEDDSVTFPLADTITNDPLMEENGSTNKDLQYIKINPINPKKMLSTVAKLNVQDFAIIRNELWHTGLYYRHKTGIFFLIGSYNLNIMSRNISFSISIHKNIWAGLSIIPINSVSLTYLHNSIKHFNKLSISVSEQDIDIPVVQLSINPITKRELHYQYPASHVSVSYYPLYVGAKSSFVNKYVVSFGIYNFRFHLIIVMFLSR
jgi:hypothetical protein